MTIAIFTNLDLESNIALNLLVPQLANHHLHFFVSKQVGSPSASIRPLQQLAYLEKDFVVEKLFPKIEEANPPGLKSFSQLSQQYNAPFRELTSVTNDDVVDDIEAKQPHLFLSIRFGKIFKGRILTIPKHGIVNLHSAILPNYKGVLGTLRAIQNGDTEIGTTIHYIEDNTVDTGSIIKISRMPVVKNHSILWHIVHLYSGGCSALASLVNSISKQEKILVQNQRDPGRYYSFPQQDDFDDLESKGLRLFDINEYAEMLSHFYKIDKRWVLENLDRSRIGSL